LAYLFHQKYDHTFATLNLLEEILKTMNEMTAINVWQPGRRSLFDRARENNVFPDIVETEFWEIAGKVWDYTALGTTALYGLYKSCLYLIENRIDGDIVECGVFFGGSIMFIAEILKRHDYSKKRRILGFDTFWGFVRRSEHDVDFEGTEVCHPSDPNWNFGREARNNIQSIGFDSDRLILIEGDVFETLKAGAKRQIALLRLDTDTYDTTKYEFETCWHKVKTGGVVIVDDYGWCQGARKAADEFLTGKKILLNRIDTTVRSLIKLE
jgi:O-methyltransferase